MLKTRDPLRVDPIYYVNIDGMNHNAFADAVMDVGDPPCVANNCDRVSKCAEEGVECFAFRIWVNNGGDLNEKQIKKACDLLATVLSPQGYGKAINIPLADDRLLRNGKRRPGFGAEDYWLAIFGKPSPSKSWGLQFDGHHIAINLAFHGGKMSMSPTFIGTQPRAFELNQKTIVPMADEAPRALNFVLSLNDEQKKQAIVSTRRTNLIAAAGRDGFIPKKTGLACKQLTKEQRQNLITLIEAYTGDMPKPFSTARLKELTGQIDQMSFSWGGPTKKGGDFSYRLQGPSLIIEYAGQDLGGDPHNHLHSMYRDPTNEYGAGLGKKK